MTKLSDHFWDDGLARGTPEYKCAAKAYYHGLSDAELVALAALVAATAACGEVDEKAEAALRAELKRRSVLP